MNFYLDKNNTKTSWNPTSKYFNLAQRQSYNGWLTQTGDNQRRLLRSDHHIPSSDCSISCSLLSSTAGGWWPGNTTCPASPADPVHTPHSSLHSFHSLCEAPQHCLFLQWSVCIWSLLALPEDPMSSPDVSVVQSVEPVSVIKTKAFRPSPHHHIECRQSVVGSLKSEVWSLKSGVWSLDLGPWNAGAEPDCPGGGVGHRTPCDPLTTLSWGVTGNTGRVT